VVGALGDPFRTEADWDTVVACTHNFVRREVHDGEELWVHRKGAMAARDGEPGIVPGSMGAESFVVTGRGCDAARRSSRGW
jgi:tRNA-splicing ligase RtcB